MLWAFVCFAAFLCFEWNFSHLPPCRLRSLPTEWLSRKHSDQIKGSETWHQFNVLAVQLTRHLIGKKFKIYFLTVLFLLLQARRN